MFLFVAAISGHREMIAGSRCGRAPTQRGADDDRTPKVWR
jgi:hypothetical protein